MAAGQLGQHCRKCRYAALAASLAVTRLNLSSGLSNSSKGMAVRLAHQNVNRRHTAQTTAVAAKPPHRTRCDILQAGNEQAQAALSGICTLSFRLSHSLSCLLVPAASQLMAVVSSSARHKKSCGGGVHWLGLSAPSHKACVEDSPNAIQVLSEFTHGRRYLHTQCICWVSRPLSV